VSGVQKDDFHQSTSNSRPVWHLVYIWLKYFSHKSVSVTGRAAPSQTLLHNGGKPPNPHFISVPYGLWTEPNITKTQTLTMGGTAPQTPVNQVYRSWGQSRILRLLCWIAPICLLVQLLVYFYSHRYWIYLVSESDETWGSTSLSHSRWIYVDQFCVMSPPRVTEQLAAIKHSEWIMFTNSVFSMPWLKG